MSFIFVAAASRLVADDVLKAHKGQRIQYFCRIDKLIYVEIADAPFRSKAYGAVKHRYDSDIILRQEFLLAYLTGSIPGRAATHNIEIIAHCNDASDDERTAAKYGVVAYG